jgi:signal peptidase I
MPADSPRAIAETDRSTATGTEHSAARRKSVVREYGEALFVALLLALFIRSFVVQAFKIPSGSMIPTLVIGDHILVNKFVY